MSTGTLGKRRILQKDSAVAGADGAQQGGALGAVGNCMLALGEAARQEQGTSCLKKATFAEMVAK